jgi:nucleoside-diphosphate-sugar epimerase
VLHLAGRAHQTHLENGNALKLFREDNVELTVDLARRAATTGVRRFVFMSTVKVNGEGTPPGKSFRPEDVPSPSDPYAVSKWEAEQALHAISQQTGMEVVIIRPPLVYGPGVKGNFASLIRLVKREVPLPLGGVHNQRSMIALDNLVSFVALCANVNNSADARGQVFLVSDGDDVSTVELLRRVARAYDHKSRMFTLPVALLRAVAGLVGRLSAADRLVGSLTLDDSKSRLLLGWRPIITMDEQLRKMAHAESN